MIVKFLREVEKVYKIYFVLPIIGLFLSVVFFELYIFSKVFVALLTNNFSASFLITTMIENIIVLSIAIIWLRDNLIQNQILIMKNFIHSVFMVEIQLLAISHMYNLESKLPKKIVAEFHPFFRIEVEK